MRTFYHGTTMESARSILKNGFNGETDTVWNCSDCDKLYVRDKDSNAIFDEDEAIYLSVSAGQIAAAVFDSKETSIAIFKFEVEDDVADSYFDEDDSCPNMDGSYQIDKSDLDYLISRNKIKCTLFESKNAYIPYLRVFYLTGVIESEYMDIDDSMLYEAVNIAAKGDNSGIWDYISTFDEPVFC